MKRLAGILSTVIILVGFAGSCTDQPLEPTAGSPIGMIDSVAWRAQMAHRQGLYLSETMTTCGDGAACTFAPTNYHCGPNKVECTFQWAPITVTPTSMTAKTFTISGLGALLCNDTMGQVIAYDTAGSVVDSVDLVPITPSDCGADNITYGGGGTVTSQSGIDHIVIKPPSPWTFPTGGGTGIATAYYTVQLNDEAIPFTVSCPATPIRASTITCTASKVDTASSAAVTGWRWVADTGVLSVVRSTNVTSLTWTGTVVASGHVEVSADVGGHPFPLPAISNSMVVQPRNWSALSAFKTLDLVSPNTLPAQPVDSEGQLGVTSSLPAVATNPNPLDSIADGGPNNTFRYYTAIPMIVHHHISINASMNSGQPFYNLQDLVAGKTQSGPHGLKYRWCWQSRVPLLQEIIKAHEGTQSEAASHVGFYNRALDSLSRVEIERVANTTGEPTSLLQSIADRAGIVDSLYDYSPQNVYKIDPALQVIFPQDTTRCRFRYFP